MSVRKLLILLLLTFIFPINIFAKENSYYLILKNNEVNVRYGPGFNYQIKYIYKKKNLPIKIIDKKENFRRIIDFKKNSGWIHISQLTKKKSAINIHDLSIVFKKSNIYSQPIAKLEKGKMVIVKKCKEDWCKIVTNGYKGWIFKNSLWGKIK